MRARRLLGALTLSVLSLCPAAVAASRADHQTPPMSTTHASDGGCHRLTSPAPLPVTRFCPLGSSLAPGESATPGPGTLRPVAVHGASAHHAQAAPGVPVDGEWQRLAPPGPGHRYGAMTAYFPAIHRTVLFGGYTLGQALHNDTWLFDGSRWTRLATKHAPPGRYLAAFAYSPALRKIVMFGGLDPHSGWPGVAASPCGMDADTWAFDGHDWAAVTTGQDPTTCQAAPVTAGQGTGGPQPFARYGPSMTYDAGSRSLILFGGFGCSSLRACAYANDTWRFTYRWTPVVTPAAATPSPRFTAVMAGDDDGTPVLFSGLHDGVPGTVTDTWTWQRTQWVAVHPDRGADRTPAPRAGAAAATWPGHGAVVVGGDPQCQQACPYLHDMWMWHRGRWTQLAATLPAGRGLYLPGLATDPNGRLLLANGLSFGTSRIANLVQSRDSAVFDGRAWRITPYAWPDPAVPLGFWWDARRHGDVLVESPWSGGSPDQTIRTWELVGGKWRLDSAAGSPTPARQLTTVGYDPGRDQAVLFGGEDLPGSVNGTVTPSGWFNDTWVWQHNRWRRAMTAHSPPPGNAQIAYDPDIKRLVMQLSPQPVLGSLDDPAPYNHWQVWTWTGDDWAPLNSLLGPTESRPFSALTYVPSRHALVLYGGNRGAVRREDLNTLELAAGSPSWTPVVGGPDPETAAPAFATSLNGNALLYGGCAQDLATSVAGGTAWAYTGDGGNGTATANGLCSTDTWLLGAIGWQRLTSANAPPPMFGAAMARLADGHLAVFGGAFEIGASDDMWEWRGVT
jgi:hypothetical protein